MLLSITLFFWSVKGLCWYYAMLVCAFNSLRNSECSRFFIVTAFSNSPGFAFDVLLDMRFTHVCKQKLNFFILHYIWDIFPTKSNYFNSNERTIYLFTYKCSRRQDTGGNKMVLRVMKLIY